MIIQNSEMMLKSSHLYQEINVEQEDLRFRAGSQTANNQTNTRSSVGLPDSNPSPALKLPEDLLDLSPGALKTANIETQLSDESISSPDEAKLNMIKYLLEALTGKKIRLLKLKDLQSADMERFTARKLNLGWRSLPLTSAPGWGLEYHYSATHQEREKVNFSAQGVVKTADGREIRIKMELNMSREFVSQQNINIRAGNAALQDPLIINYARPAAALTERNFRFDLDADGSEDLISFVQPGSGFLALDKNGDGTINDGQELFGPQSGNGFNELRTYDADGNNWIDENDPVFKQLRVWTRDEKGNNTLLALGEVGVGAIYLGAVNTDFSLKNEVNDTQGQLRSTSLFLREDGSAGTIQQVDLVV
jgi:hypothetical protein